jgi:CheY-like chemotaxis protein
MGGTLTLESEPGRGSTFVATIPLGTPGDGLGRATGGSSRPDPRVATPAAQGRGQILVVEDNDLNQNVLVRILNKLGYGSEVVGNGRQAVDAVGQKRYAAVLMDCHMPEMDGYQATAEIRRLEAEARHTPIIALTASALAEDRDSCLAAGMDDYIPKPFRIDRLRDALSQWVRG